MAKRVLLVDDNEGIRAVLRMSFELTGGFEVVGDAENGAEAIAKAEESDPDVVVLDVAMPVMGGMEALPQIRRRLPGGKIIVYTACFDQGTRADALDLGADVYLEKMVVPSEVVKVAIDLTDTVSPGAP